MGGCMGSKEPKPDSDKKPNAQPQGQSKNEGSKKSGGEDANPKPTKEIINPITPGKVDEFYEFGKEIGKYVKLLACIYTINSPNPFASKHRSKTLC